MKASEPPPLSFLDVWGAGVRELREQVAQEARSVYWDVWPPAPYGVMGEDIPRSEDIALPLKSWRHWSAR